MDEILYNLNGFDTSTYFLRESVSDSFETSGIVSYLLNRETRTSDTMVWELDSVWSVRVQDNLVIVNSGNINQVVLSNPVVPGKSWDRNSLNTYGTENVEYQEVGSLDLLSEVSQIGNLDLIKVSISDQPANIVDQDERYEVYAQDVGLVQKYSRVLQFCTVDCDSAGQITNGISLTQNLLSYGSIE